MFDRVSRAPWSLITLQGNPPRNNLSRPGDREFTRDTKGVSLMSMFRTPTGIPLSLGGFLLGAAAGGGAALVTRI